MTVLRKWRSVVPVLLLVGLAFSIAANAYLLSDSTNIVGIADSKQIGERTDRRGEPTKWYTVSLALVTDDKKNNLKIGATLAYIIDKKDFDRIRNGTLVNGRPGDELRLNGLELTYAERFETAHGLFFRQERSQ